MNWFAKNGDKVLSLLTLALGLITTQATSLGLNPKAVAWGVVISAIATAAHTIFYPGTPPTKETPK